MTPAYIVAISTVWILTDVLSARQTPGPTEHQPVTSDHISARQEHLGGNCTDGIDGVTLKATYRVADRSHDHPPRFWCKWGDDRTISLYMIPDGTEEPTVVFIEFIQPMGQAESYLISGQLLSDGAVLTAPGTKHELDGNFRFDFVAAPSREFMLRMSCMTVCEARLTDFQIVPNKTNTSLENPSN